MFWFSNSRLTRLTFFITSCRCDESHFVTFFRRTVWKGKKIIKHIALLFLLRCCWFTYCKMTQGTMMGPASVSVTSCQGQAVAYWTLPLNAMFVFHMWALVWEKKPLINIIRSHSIWRQKYSEIPSRRYLYPARLILEQKSSQSGTETDVIVPF